MFLVNSSLELQVFNDLESNVRKYIRDYPTVFTEAEGYTLRDQSGNEYIDFLSGAGVLNYGHNNPTLKKLLIAYIEKNGIVHSLDMATIAKKKFLTSFSKIILKPKKLNYKIQFVGPTGTNAIEASLKLARKVTGRTNIVSFYNAFHGSTLGSLSLSNNLKRRKSAGVPLEHVKFIPFDTGNGNIKDTLKPLQQFLEHSKNNTECPAAIILETVQADGGVNVARSEWLVEVYNLSKKYGVLFIVDDIQVGCGRTGTFFSFERASIKPDIVCLSKSLSGYGFPMSVVLIRPDLDQWYPGEHDGTFRGNNLAFITAIEALEFWNTDKLIKSIKNNSIWLELRLQKLQEQADGLIKNFRGIGFIWGVNVIKAELARKIRRDAFDRGLIIELVGQNEQIIKLLPPLTIDRSGLEIGMSILSDCIKSY